jgi:hypothetical protein
MDAGGRGFETASAGTAGHGRTAELAAIGGGATGVIGAIDRGGGG